MFRRLIRRIAFVAAAGAACLTLPALAQLRVEVVGVGSSQFPIAIAGFQRVGSVPGDVDAIIRADLQRSGEFRLIDAGATTLGENAPVAYAQWKQQGADALVVGTIAQLADGRFDIRYRLYDTVKQTQLDGLAYVSSAEELRVTAHRIADRIYEKLTGFPGVFATRIAYVVQLAKNRFELQVADADGGNPQTMLRSREPIMSPVWSPDGSRIAYVSFESAKPVVYVHTLATAKRQVLANFRGSNSAPAWSPDGRTLALALTLEGGTQIYTIGADGSGLKRLTRSGAIDTEPRYSADGKYIYFTSDRGGGPQVYRMSPDGSGVQRVTFEGDYNVTPRPSPDGRLLAYVTRRDGRFQVRTLELATGQTATITDTGLDESPSFAPNGRIVLYATEIGGRGVLASASIDGRARARLSGPSGDIREPTWGPFTK